MTNSAKSPCTRSRDDINGNRDRGGNDSNRKQQGVLEGAGKTTEEQSTWATQASTTGRQDDNRLTEATAAANHKNNVSATRNETHTTQELESHRQETTAEMDPNQGAANTGTMAEDRNTLVHAAEDTSQTMGVKAPTEVSPKEWQKHHDQWLNAVMHNAIGKENHPPIPNLNDYIQVH